MKKLHDILAYFCKNTHSKSDLSKARITKLVYLADWMSATETGEQMTNIQWVFNHYGPYVNDVVEFARTNPDFTVNQTVNDYGSFKEEISLTDPDRIIPIDLSQTEEKILSKILELTSPMYFNSFIDYIYSTYPVANSERYDVFDLTQLAKESKAKQPLHALH